MRFKRVNYKNLRLGPGDKISPTYIRLVEKDSRLHQFAQKNSDTKTVEAVPENVEHSEKDFSSRGNEQ